MNEEQRTRAERAVAPFCELPIDVWTGEALCWKIQLLQDDIARLQLHAREAALYEVQEYVVAHAFDTTVGRRIHEFITERLAALADDEPPLGPEIHPDPRSSFWK